MKIGSLKEKAFEELWNSDRAEEARWLIKAGKCKRCWSGCESTTSLLSNPHRFWWRLL